jgi:hypothetical protein
MRLTRVAGVLVLGTAAAFAQISSARLAGEWTRSHAAPSGERLSVRFFPDGRYKLGWALQSSVENCSSRVFGYKAGRYQLEGTALTMQDQSSTLSSQDTCHAEWNYEKHAPLAKSTYQLRLATSKSGPMLIMRGPDGKETAYARETGKPSLN